MHARDLHRSRAHFRLLTPCQLTLFLTQLLTLSLTKCHFQFIETVTDLHDTVSFNTGNDTVTDTVIDKVSISVV
jgi:hypothetical protein